MVFGVKKHSNNLFQGSRDVLIDEFEEEAELRKQGSGDLTISCPIPAKAIINQEGSGNLTLYTLGDQVSLVREGSGDCQIAGSIGSKFHLEKSGSGQIIIEGDVGSGAQFSIKGTGWIYFKGSVCDDLEFSGGLETPVYFEKKPSDTILKKIKAAQELAIKEALISDSQFNSATVNSYTLKTKSIAGHFFIKKDDRLYIYKGSHFICRNDDWFVDGKQVRGQVENKSIFAKIDRFSQNHPLLFLVLTVGLGLFWYLGKFLGQPSSFGTNETFTMELRSDDSELDENAYYLADLNKVIEETGNIHYVTNLEERVPIKVEQSTIGSSPTHMLNKMPPSTPAPTVSSSMESKGKPFAWSAGSEDPKMKTKEEEPEVGQTNNLQ